jgi:WD40 repeat protein
MSLPAARIQETRAIQPRQKFEGHTVSVSGVTLLPGGQQIITCSYDGSLRLWNLESGVQIGNDWQDGESPVISMALSPDGTTVASGSGDGAVRLWNIDTGKVITKWTGHAGSVKSLCWRRDGGQVVSASFDGTARMWDVESGESILGPIKIGFDADVVIYSPNSTMIATGVVTFPKKEYVKIWNANTGELLTSLREHRYTVTCLAWTADGRTLISGSLGNSIRTWNTTTWEQMAVLTGHTSSVHAIVVSPSGCIFASASLDGTARLWNIENGQPIGSPLQHANLVSSLSFSADGHLLATGCADKNAYLWDISEIVRVPGPNELHLNATVSCAFLISLLKYQLNVPPRTVTAAMYVTHLEIQLVESSLNMDSRPILYKV